MTLWLVLAAMSAVAAALVVWPLIAGKRRTSSRDAHALEIYRDQLDEVGRDLDRGIISETEAESARTEISRRILALDATATADAAPDGKADAGAKPSRRAPVAAIVAGLLIPLGAGVVYLMHGSPGLPDEPAAERLAAAAPSTDESTLKAQVATLADALQKDPGNLRNWVMLGDALIGLKRYDKASTAYQQAMRLAPGSSELASRYGEALTFANNGQVTPAARKAFEESLRRNAAQPRAMYYIGLADRQGGRLHAALRRWLALEAESPPNAPWLRFLKPRIAALADQLKLDDTALAELRRKARTEAGAPPMAAGSGTAPGPTRKQMDAARNMSAADRMNMIRGMVDRLAGKLEKNPDDVDGWLRLARARAVLGEHDKASAAYAKAAALKPDNVQVLVAWSDSIVAAAKPSPPKPADLKPVVDRILALDPKQPRALWLAGALAVSAGDDATARARWTTLLGELKPDSVQYMELKKQIDALPPAK